MTSGEKAIVRDLIIVAVAAAGALRIHQIGSAASEPERWLRVAVRASLAALVVLGVTFVVILTYDTIRLA